MGLQKKIQEVIDFRKIYDVPDEYFNWLEFAQDYAEYYHNEQLRNMSDN